MLSENKAVVRSFFEVQDREGRTPAELCSSDFTAHLPGAPSMDFAAFEQREVMFFTAFSDVKHPIDDMVAEGDRVAFRIVGIGIMRIAEGKIADFWGSLDAIGLMQQIGALPTPDQRA